MTRRVSQIYIIIFVKVSEDSILKTIPLNKRAHGYQTRYCNMRWTIGQLRVFVLKLY